jgi:ferredoxin
MRVVHDAGLCEAHGVCTAVDPDRFELDDADNLMVHSHDVAEADLDVVRQAVESCPRQALSVQE